MRVLPFTPQEAERWDALVRAAPMATFLHSRRFLSYHGDRFADASLLFVDDDAVRGVLPAALDPVDPARVVSHPGATYGGLVHDGRLHGDSVRDALAAALEHYRAQGVASMRYKPVPPIYHLSPSADDVWALHALGASRVGCALSCAIDLAGRRSPTTRRLRSRRKAERGGVDIRTDLELADFWPVLETTLRGRYATAPVHSLEEIELLHDRFPRAIRLVGGRLEGETVAGAVVFHTPRVVHVQYMAASQAGRRVGALDAVLERAIELAAEAGVRYFDLGTSMRDRGEELQVDLHRFKAEFGGGGVVYEHYDLDVRGDAP
jgi:hypothetical protein